LGTALAQGGAYRGVIAAHPLERSPKPQDGICLPGPGGRAQFNDEVRLLCSPARGFAAARVG
ncbi:MAG: hypothetical protein ABSH34_32060, partial [Verrucomicrobiota bacterium]